MQEFIKCLQAYIKKEQLDNIDDSNALLKIALEQSLQTILYPVYRNSLYKKYYVSWVTKQEQFFDVQKDITNIFNEHNIKHLFFKGSVLAYLYDDPSIRTRGDIDLYVDSNDFTKAKELLIKNDYILDKDIIDCMHHESLKKNGIEIELHFSLFDTDCDKSWLKLYEHPFELAKLEENSLYKMKDTYHLIYCILHFARHLRHGAGLRYILDFYYMFSKTNIDFELLHNKIKELEIEILYSNIINVIRFIFEIDFDKSIQNKDINFFIDYMMQYGIHGNSNNETTINASHDNKFRYFITRVFLLNKHYRITRYPKLGSHWYIYPICVIKHWIFLISHKFKAFIKFLFGKNNNKKLYKELGI